MMNFRKARFMVLAGMLALVVAVFATSSAEAGCGYGGAVYSSYYTPAVSYVHTPVYNYHSFYPTYYKTYYTTPSCHLHW